MLEQMVLTCKCDQKWVRAQAHKQMNKQTKKQTEAQVEQTSVEQ